MNSRSHVRNSVLLYLEWEQGATSRCEAGLEGVTDSWLGIWARARALKALFIAEGMWSGVERVSPTLLRCSGVVIDKQVSNNVHAVIVRLAS